MLTHLTNVHANDLGPHLKVELHSAEQKHFEEIAKLHSFLVLSDIDVLVRDEAFHIRPDKFKLSSTTYNELSFCLVVCAYFVLLERAHYDMIVRIAPNLKFRILEDNL